MDAVIAVGDVDSIVRRVRAHLEAGADHVCVQLREERSTDPALAALLGYVPWSDARGHFEGGLRLLSDGAFGSFSERRPLNAAWLSVQLALSGGRLWPLGSFLAVFLVAGSFTGGLRSAGESLSVPLADHMVLGSDRWHSFRAAEGWDRN